MSRSHPIACHVTTRLEADRVLAASPPERRLLARVLLGLGWEGKLLAFSAADTHLHLLTAAQEAEAMQLARRLEIALQRRLRLGSPFERARCRPIMDLWHLGRSLRYLFQQEARHGLVGHDLSEATSLPDLLGMRPLGSYLAERVERHLPRLTQQEVLSWVGRRSLQPASGPALLVPEAACRATCLPSLSGTGREVLVARRAALEVLRTPLGMAQAAALLGLSRSASYRLVSRPADEGLVRAISLQLDWLTHTGSEGAEGASPHLGAINLARHKPMTDLYSDRVSIQLGESHRSGPFPEGFTW